MKRWLQALGGRVAANDTLWNALDSSVLRITDYLGRQRREVVRARRNESCDQLTKDAIEQVCPDLVVRHGPFAGMRYPTLQAVYSTLFPKLLGSYEREVTETIEDICKRGYSAAVDVGCAEGYYAVGLALRNPDLRVYAFDTNPEAIRLCRLMATLNGVSDRILTGSRCDSTTLNALPLGPHALILADCEGYERKLFNRSIADDLARHDLLIEVHDFIDITISDHLRESFSATHTLSIIQSVDDIAKARQYDYPELRGFDVASRRLLLRENRPAAMEWFFFRALHRPDSSSSTVVPNAVHDHE